MTSTELGAVARRLNDGARRLGLVPAAFRSPPGLANTPRTVRRLGPETVLVAVARSGRPASDVVADMVDGILRANPAAEEPAKLREHLLDLAGDSCDAKI